MADKKVLKVKLGECSSPQEELDSLGDEILDGFREEFCGTGRRIDELSGAAKFNAVLRNIGDGSMKDGFKKLCKFFYLNGFLDGDLPPSGTVVLSLEVR